MNYLMVTKQILEKRGHDNITEKSVIDSLYNLKSEVTIIIISHTISNLKRCDNIIYLEKGEIKRQGTFEQLKDDYKFSS